VPFPLIILLEYFLLLLKLFCQYNDLIVLNKMLIYNNNQVDIHRSITLTNQSGGRMVMIRLTVADSTNQIHRVNLQEI